MQFKAEIWRTNIKLHILQYYDEASEKMSLPWKQATSIYEENETWIFKD